MQTLHILDLSYNQISAIGAQELAATLGTNIVMSLSFLSSHIHVYLRTQTLTTLNLSSNYIGSAGVQHLAYALRSNKVTFTFFISLVFLFIFLRRSSLHSIYQRIKSVIKELNI